MSEPVRYIGSGGLKAQLLASARGDRPPKGSRRRAILAAAAVAGATSTKAASATATVSSMLGRWALWKWIAVSAIGAGTVIAAKGVILPPRADTASLWAPLASSPKSAAPGVGRSPAPGSPSAPLPAGVAHREDESPLPPPPSPPTNPAVFTTAPKVATVTSPAALGRAATPATETPKDDPKTEARSAPSTPNSTLAAEIAAIDHAKRALAIGNPGEALRRLDAYKVAFLRGTLDAEATALRVEALARAGRHEESQAELTRLRASHPDSPLLENLTQVVGE